MSYLACWLARLEEHGSARQRAAQAHLETFPSDGPNCSCAAAPPASACINTASEHQLASTWPVEGDSERLVLAITAHIRTSNDMLLLLRCVCSVLAAAPRCAVRCERAAV